MGIIGGHDTAIGISVGTVLYKNTEAQVAQFARSLKLAAECLIERSGIPTKLFVLENSEVNSEELLKSELAGSVAVSYLPRQGNIGFGAGMNRLMAQSFEESNTFVMANPDGAFHAQCLMQLYQKSLNCPKAIIEARQFPEELSKIYNMSTGETDWASGACLLVTKEIFEKTAGFDERFFLYLEDVDFSWRVRQCGYQIFLCSDAYFSHSVLGRSNDAIERTFRHALKSGIFLGQKWNNQRFSDQCAEQLKRLTLSDGSSLQPLATMEEPTQWDVPTALNFKPDFDHGFAFAEFRWH